jgi:ubiquitin-protein ligase
MKIPDDYPSKPPKIYFQTKVLHPCIDAETGLLDLDVIYLNYFLKIN